MTSFWMNSRHLISIQKVNLILFIQEKQVKKVYFFSFQVIIKYQPDDLIIKSLPTQRGGEKCS